MMKNLLSITIAMMLLLTLGACNTMKGLGKDVERGGEKVQDAATSTQNSK